MFAALQGGTKVVERLSIHGATDFLTLCERAVTPETRYLVLDLDRTIHFGHNVGELLGFELSAYEAYGERYLAVCQTRTDRRKLFVDRSDPIGMLKYFFVAMGRWALPGLAYLFYVKIAAKLPFLRRRVFRRFGLEPIEEVQNLMRETLIEQLADVPLSTARELVRGIWRRLAPDQVVKREDITALRERFPGLRIVLSSASPQPVLEVAREELGVDYVLYTQVEEHEGFLSVPHEIGVRHGEPRRISPPSQTSHNAAAHKIDRLAREFADFSDPAVEKVGITDTSYGEDHVWAHHFTKVVDVNSPHPFSPIVPTGAPTHEIHSAPVVLTRLELERRAAGEPAFLDRRRPESNLTAVVFSGSELQERVARATEGLKRLFETSRKNWDAVRRSQEALAARAVQLVQEIEANVHEYNRSLGKTRRAALRKLKRQMRTLHKVRRRIAAAQRPVTEAAFKTAMTLEEARKRLLTKPTRPEP